MHPKDLLKNILTDIKVDLSQEFDKNFERKSFFGKKWPNTKLINKRGSMMARTNALRRSIQGKVNTNSVSWSSSLPYASIQNDGGEIVVTQKMKKFFWAMHYKTSNASKGKSKKAEAMSIEAKQWKALALQPVGAKMKVEQRQFIGLNSPVVKSSIKQIIDQNFMELNDHFKNKLKP